jgi:hypothetical protein
LNFKSFFYKGLICKVIFSIYLRLRFVIFKIIAIINSKRAIRIFEGGKTMSEKNVYQTLDKVPRDGVYLCDVCDDSLNQEVEVELKKGDYFPKCSKCGDVDIWRLK